MRKEKEDGVRGWKRRRGEDERRKGAMKED